MWQALALSPSTGSHDGTFAVLVCGSKGKPHKGTHSFMRGSLPEGLTSSQQVLVNWGGEHLDSSHTTWSSLSSPHQPHKVKIVVLSPLYPEDNMPQINGRERGHVTEDSQAASWVTRTGPKDPRSLGDTSTFTSLGRWLDRDHCLVSVT